MVEMVSFGVSEDVQLTKKIVKVGELGRGT